MSKYRLWNVVNPPSLARLYPVSGPKEAFELMTRLADEQLIDPDVEANAFGLETYDAEADEWEEWYDEFGYGLDEYSSAPTEATL